MPPTSTLRPAAAAQRPLPWIALAVLLASAGTSRADDPRDFRRAVEEDWSRQDESRLRQIRERGRVRFVEEEIDWPGVAEERRQPLERIEPPVIDGRLDDPGWKDAWSPAGAEAGAPRFHLGRGGGHLYIAATFPAADAVRYLGLPTAWDASGAVDGVKDGKYAFHTGSEPRPWWQVDLGESAAIGTIVIYNRLDYAPGLHNADGIQILTSDDGRAWALRHDNKGRHFGGVGQGEPLRVDLGPGSAAGGAAGVRARFVRLQLPVDAPIFFHLDEVEIHPPDDAGTNLALHRPASQSSLSIWSRGGLKGSGLCWLGRACVGLAGREASGLLVDGSPWPEERGVVRRRGDSIAVEMAWPLRGDKAGAPETFQPAGGTPIAIDASGWSLAWPGDPRLGAGANRVLLELLADGELDPPVAIEVESVVFTPRRAVRQVVHSGVHSRGGSIPILFEPQGEGAAALIARARQGERQRSDGRAYFIEPLAETIARAELLADETGGHRPQELAELRTRASALLERERSEGPDPEARRAMYLEARWIARRIAFRRPLLDFDRLLFVKRFTQETYPDVCLNHMPWVSRPGGDICILELDGEGGPGRVRELIEGRLGPGHVHGMDLSWDGSRIVFGYAKSKSPDPPAGWLDRRESYRLRREEEPTHIFEMRADGGGLRQITHGEWSDLDPTYLPSGEIAFTSERCGCSLQCNEYDKDETSCNIYICRPDGSSIRRLSVTKDGDYLPRALADGTIGYTRWEYQERGWAHIQSIWTVRPDGTGADGVFKQHMNDPWALEDVRSIPGAETLAAIAAGHHTLAAGPLVIVDPRGGLNRAEGIRIVTPGIEPPEGGMAGRVVAEGGVMGKGGFCMTPWPLSEECFLISRNYGAETEPAGYAIYLADVHGTMELIHRDPDISCFQPIPLRPRGPAPILASATEPGDRLATCVVADVTRGVDGVQRGEPRYLRIASRIAWPYDNQRGGQRYEPDVKAVMVNWTPVRIIGTVPIEADGSAHFRVPVDTAVYFQLLDEDRMELRRMRSFISLQPGEARGCVGCHETRAEAPPAGATPMALLRPASIPEPPPWGSVAMSFLRDVQPVLDRLCVECHSGARPEGGLDFSGGLTARYNRAYETISDNRLVARSDVGEDAKVTPPLAFGSHRSRLVEVLRGREHRERAVLSGDDWLRIVTWIDANAPYHDGFIDKRPAEPPYDIAADRRLSEEIQALHRKRCAGCHGAAEVSRIDWIDIHEPSRSLFLRAPLAAEARGGAPSRCAGQVYRDAQDEDYIVALRIVASAVDAAWRRPRRDLAALPRSEAVETARR